MSSLDEDQQEQPEKKENRDSQPQSNEDKKSKDFNEDKFTWKEGDLVFYERLEDIPGYTPFPGIEKKRRKIVWGGGIIYEGNGGDNKEEKK